MKKVFTLLAATLFCAAAVSAQGVGINTTPAATAALDVSSTSKGVLVPRMTTAQRSNIATANSVSAPATGLMVYDTDLNAFYYWNGTSWAAVGSSAASAGASLQLAATKTSGSQVLPLANSTNTGDPISFDNVSAAPAPGTGSYNAATGVYTVGAAGAGSYLIQARAIALDNAGSPTNTVGSWIFIEVNSSPAGSPNNVYPAYVGSTGGNLPAGMRSNPGFVQGLVRLNAGDTFRIKGLGSNSATAAQALKTDGSCNLTVMKLN